MNIIPTGLELDKFYRGNYSEEDLRFMRESFRIDENEFLCVYIGRIAEEKSIDLLIDMFSKIKDKNFKAFSKIIAESFNGVINTPLNEEYVNKERDIIYAEIQTRNPGDSYDITKIHMLNAITGGDFSAIGSKEYLENVTIDTLEALRHKVFRTDKVMEIKITVPEVVTDEEIKELVDNLMSSIYEAETSEAYYDVDKVDVDIIKAVMSDYVPDEISYSYATIDSHTPAINMKKEIYDFVTKPNATEMMKAIFVLPTCKISMEDNLKEFMYSHYAWLIIKVALNEFYREKYPYLYRSSSFVSTFFKDNTKQIHKAI